MEFHKNSIIPANATGPAIWRPRTGDGPRHHVSASCTHIVYIILWFIWNEKELKSNGDMPLTIDMRNVGPRIFHLLRAPRNLNPALCPWKQNIVFCGFGLRWGLCMEIQWRSKEVVSTTFFKMSGVYIFSWKIRPRYEWFQTRTLVTRIYWAGRQRVKAYFKI